MVSLERQGFGARAGLTLLGVPGEGRDKTSLLGVAGDSPGLWGSVSFGLGARGGLCTPEFILASLSLLLFGKKLIINH